MYKSKYLTFQSAVTNKKNDWRLQQREVAVGAVTQDMANHVKLFTSESKFSELTSDIELFKRDLMAQNRCQKEDILFVPVLNWRAMPSLKAKAVETHSAIACWGLQATPNGVGLVTLPVFSYHKGGLWTSQVTAAQSLKLAGLNVDTEVSLMFKDRVDFRDRRPMVYPCRLLFNNFTDVFDRGNIWQKSSFMQSNRP